MPRFFFHIHNGNGHTPDEEGQEVAGEAEARQTAVQGARSLMSEEVMEGDLDLGGRIDVVDEQGVTITSVAFREAIRISGLQ